MMTHIVRRAFRWIVVLSVGAGPVSAQVTGTTKQDSSAVRYPCRRDANIHRFDFWIGEWSVRVNGTEAGINRIERAADQCALIEHWSSRSGNSGESLNWYEPRSRKWRQVFVYDNGEIDDYTGEWKEGTLVFLTPRIDTGRKSTQQRMTFFPLARDSLSQVIEASSDSGRTWKATFRSTYHRLAPDSIAVLRRATGIIDADNARNLDRVLDSYSPDAVLLPPDGREVRGRADIRARYEALFRANQPHLRTEIREIIVSGNWAMVRGRNLGSIAPLRGGAARSVSDTYVEILQKGADRQWRIARLMWAATPP
jgi:uncharacterized protein (TIGR02246 family)